MNNTERLDFLKRMRELFKSHILRLYKKCNFDFDLMILSILTALKKNDLSATENDIKLAFGIRINGSRTLLDFDEESIVDKFLQTTSIVNKVLEGDISERDLIVDLKQFFEYSENEVKNAIKIKKKKSPDSGDLGKWAFPSQRKKDILPYEEDTDVEEDISIDLDRHFNNNTSIGDKESLAIQKFLANNEYCDVFKQPTEKKVYRGMGVSSTWLKNVLNDRYDDNAYSGKINKNFVFNPLENVEGSTSWTSNKKIAEKFAKDSCDNNMQDIKIVLIANPAENKNRFLVCKNGLYKLSITQGFEYEKEIIGLGPINISSIEWKV